jgi:hypothetical protein
MVNHLRRQGVRAESADGSCLYRGPDGTKCAVGCLIPDDVYHRDMEKLSVEALLKDTPVTACGERDVNSRQAILALNWEVDAALLSTMQNVHDVWCPHTWEDRFLEVADKWNLEIPSLSESEVPGPDFKHEKKGFPWAGVLFIAGCLVVSTAPIWMPLLLPLQGGF